MRGKHHARLCASEPRSSTARWRTYTGRFVAQPSRMVYSIAIILVLVWVIAIMSSATLGGFIHVLLALAALLILFRIIGAPAR